MHPLLMPGAGYILTEPQSNAINSAPPQNLSFTYNIDPKRTDHIPLMTSTGSELVARAADGYAGAGRRRGMRILSLGKKLLLLVVQS